ncbi:hypothetical protein B6D29_02295 [Microgenomates bacterium UTCPR1]|nr:MAG: hypothetical protein B6D29_02295 [Microgenomates bacterium UTCPR1]
MSIKKGFKSKDLITRTIFIAGFFLVLATTLPILVINSQKLALRNQLQACLDEAEGKYLNSIKALASIPKDQEMIISKDQMANALSKGLENNRRKCVDRYK